MTTPQQIEYIRRQLAAGVSKADIAKALVTNGWKVSDVNEAFGILTPNISQPVVPHVPPAPTAPPPHLPGYPMTAQPAPTSLLTFRRKIFVAILLVAVFGTVAYAYTQKIGPFAHIPYTKDNLVSGLLSSSGRINTSSYEASFTLDVVPRDVDATPFTVQVSNEEELLEQYKNDSTRAGNIRYLLYALRDEKGGYPSTLQQLAANATSRRSYYARSISLVDPDSGTRYGYTTTNGGTNFALTATFDTKGAISAIRKSYKYSATTTPINGQTVTFTKESQTSFSVPSKPPKPFLVQLGEMMRSLPAEIMVSSSVSATTDWTKKDAADWSFNFNVAGDFGDLSFKVNADALKKDKDYYFRINNIPSFLGNFFASVKGEWVKIDLDSLSTTTLGRYNQFKSLAAKMPEIEKNYKENRAKALESIRKTAGFADETHLFAFKNAPHSERVEGKLLYRYDLQINKDAIIPFYNKLADEANTNKTIRSSRVLNDPGIIEYFQSDEFSEVFEYYNKNTSLTLWVDPKGFPAILQYTMRIVPPDTAIQLKEKQVETTWELTISNINEPVHISAPADWKPIQELIDQLDANNNYSL